MGKLEWEPTILLRADLTSALATVKAETGTTIQVPGSPKLVRSLLHEGLLDELSFTICPEVVGSYQDYRAKEALAAVRSGSGQNFPCENPSASTRNALLNRAR